MFTDESKRLLFHPLPTVKIINGISTVVIVGYHCNIVTDETS
jgi:hypothetical protein